jgi:hypothetical protein
MIVYIHLSLKVHQNKLEECTVIPCALKYRLADWAELDVLQNVLEAADVFGHKNQLKME